MHVEALPAKQVAFAAVGYPNPFNSEFNLDVRTASESQISIKVYDITGRLLEMKNMEVSELAAGGIGANYPSGVYNIIVSQGQDVVTLRMIKR